MRSLCAALLSLLLLFSGCSLLGDPGDAGIKDGPGQDLAFGDDRAPSTVAPELRDRGGVLRVGVAATTWADPALIDEAREGEQQIADLLFDGLTVVAEAGALEPALASSWSANADTTEWTFVMALDARFSDGSAVRPLDVKYSLERVAALGVESLAGNQLRNLEGVEALDDSVVLTFGQPFAALPRLLAAPIFGVVPADSGEGSGLPVSSGALAVESAIDGLIDLVPVAEDNSYVDGISLYLFEDEEAVALAFADGQLDLASTNSPIDADAGGSDDDESGAERRVLKGFDTSFFLMNLGNESFADPLIRQALVLAVDTGFVASGVSGATLEGLLPTSSNSWRPGVCGDCAYQPDRAREILGSYGAGELPLIHVDHLDDPQSEQTAKALVDDLQHVGFEVRARPHSPEAFASKAAAGELSLFQFGMIGSWESPEAYLGSLFATDGAENVTSFSDPEVDRLLAEATETLDDDARALLYQQVETRILSFSVAIPLFERVRTWNIGPNVKNVRSGGLGSFDPQVVWISAE